MINFIPVKRFFIIAFVLTVIIIPESFGQKGRNQLVVKPDSTATDSVTYELVVFDQGFDSWLFTQPQMNFYSKEYYESRNRLYVIEWNYRCDHPMRFGDLYDLKIDYDPFTDYGIDLNYRLYNYFRYFEVTNRTKLTNLSH